MTTEEYSRLVRSTIPRTCATCSRPIAIRDYYFAELIRPAKTLRPHCLRCASRIGKIAGPWSDVVYRFASGGIVVADDYRLPLRLDLVNHSPTGFAWGYGGSGPAQLAVALLAHEFGADVALRFYQPFKTQFLVPRQWADQVEADAPVRELWRWTSTEVRAMAGQIGVDVPKGGPANGGA